jgi:hypothetical protein
MTFEAFPKIARLKRNAVISEKIDGTNAQIFITDDGDVLAGSRNRMVTVASDNYGFARWVEGNKAELLKLGPGRHFGEWWGHGIQRGYNQKEKRFSLFNSFRWKDPAERPACCEVVPVLWYGEFATEPVDWCIQKLRDSGSVAAPGFMNPEGIVVWHDAAKQMFKVTCENDNQPESLAA